MVVSGSPWVRLTISTVLVPERGSSLISRINVPFSPRATAVQISNVRTSGASLPIAPAGIVVDVRCPWDSISRMAWGPRFSLVVLPPTRCTPGAAVVVEQSCAAPGVDIVNIFRRSEFVGAIVEQAIERQLPAVWMQEGVVDREAAERARRAGILVVMDRCILKLHHALLA